MNYRIQIKEPTASGDRLAWRFIRMGREFPTVREAYEAACELDQDGLWDPKFTRIVAARITRSQIMRTNLKSRIEADKMFIRRRELRAYIHGVARGGRALSKNEHRCTSDAYEQAFERGRLTDEEYSTLKMARLVAKVRARELLKTRAPARKARKEACK